LVVSAIHHDGRCDVFAGRTISVAAVPRMPHEFGDVGFARLEDPYPKEVEHGHERKVEWVVRQHGRVNLDSGLQVR